MTTRQQSFAYTDADLDFLLEAGAPEVRDKARLRRLLELDTDFREAFISDDKTFQRLMADDEVFLRISPRLYFEILLRRTREHLDNLAYTIERTGTQKVAVFDSKEVYTFLSNRAVVSYLADMLASFTRVQSYTFYSRVKERIWRKIRFNDMDIDSLIRFCDYVDDDERFAFFKRIADICLFVLGVFPEFVEFERRYPFSGEMRPQVPGKVRRSLEAYAEEGRRFYELAAEHPAAKMGDLSGVFGILHSNFHTAKKPLNFLAEHYLHYRRSHLFGLRGAAH